LHVRLVLFIFLNSFFLAIVDKTADYVVRNGPAFEHKILLNEKDNPMFSFLRATDPFHAYYKQKLAEFRGLLKGGVEEVANVIPPALTKKPAEKKETKPVQLKPPDPEEWIFEVPHVPASELNINEAMFLEMMKLAAQFTAKNGKGFAVGLQNRESRNEQFEFLKPHHYLHKHFEKLVDHYSKTIYPPANLMQKLEALQDKHKVYARLLERVDWEKAQRSAKEEENPEEKERIERQQIDWKDFVVVETITFDEESEVPLATLLPEKVEVDQVKVEGGMGDIDMEVEMEEEDEEEENLKIRKEPVRTKVEGAPTETLKYTICPKCGDKIPLDEIEEHMKIELLDPISRQRRLEQQRRKKASTLAEGSEIGANLKFFSKYRSDIFGDAGEVAIGKQVGVEEEEKAKSAKVIWDGHTGSIAVTAAAVMAGMTAEERQRQAAGVDKGPGATLPPAISTPSIPTPGAPVNVPGITPGVPLGVPPRPGIPMPTPVPVSVQIPGQPGVVPLRPPAMGPGMGAPGMMPMMGPGMPMPPMLAPGMPPMYGMPGMAPPMPGGEAMHPHPPVAEAQQPSSKKQRLGPSLLSEEEFLAAHPGPVKVSVAVPAQDKPEWNFNGQTLTFEMDPKQTITDLKNLLKDQLGGMPPAKQKLEVRGIGFLKDGATLASLNITNDTVITLGVKARGRGGKK
jgi:splicing factor 3A subunit 1